MGDVKLTARETSRLLTHLEEGVQQVTDARAEIIEAMARRTTRGTAEPEPPRTKKTRQKKR